MVEKPRQEPDERLQLPGGWTGLYLFIVGYGILQVILLYLFTLIFNSV